MATPSCLTGEVLGPCCFTDGTCRVLTAVACQDLHGSFIGRIACTPGPCSVVKYGACCVGTICNVVTPVVCTNLHGACFGDDTICDPYPCVIPVETRSRGQIKSSYR
jgi:hypothetical protein